MKYDYTICYLIVRQIQSLYVYLFQKLYIEVICNQSYFRKLTFSNLSKIYHQLNYHFLLILFWWIWHSKCVEKEGGEKENLIWLELCLDLKSLMKAALYIMTYNIQIKFARVLSLGRWSNPKTWNTMNYFESGKFDEALGLTYLKSFGN